MNRTSAAGIRNRTPPTTVALKNDVMVRVLSWVNPNLILTGQISTREALWRPFLLRRLRRRREEAIVRARQAEVLAQGPALVLGAEDAAALQLGHDLVDEVVEPARQVGEHDVEAVGGFGLEPLLHLVGDHRRRADHAEP